MAPVVVTCNPVLGLRFEERNVRKALCRLLLAVGRAKSRVTVDQLAHGPGCGRGPDPKTARTRNSAITKSSRTP